MQMKPKTGLLDGRAGAVFSARESGVRAIPQKLNDALGCGADTIHERAPIGIEPCLAWVESRIS